MRLNLHILGNQSNEEKNELLLIETLLHQVYILILKYMISY